ncbi:hypothetical protein Tco_0236224 [Tanacetum coccineum]
MQTNQDKSKKKFHDYLVNDFITTTSSIFKNNDLKGSPNQDWIQTLHLRQAFLVKIWRLSSHVRMFLNVNALENTLTTKNFKKIGSMALLNIGTESKEQDTSSRSGNDAHVNDADIRPIYNEELMAEVQMTDDNVSATGQQHTE